MILAIDAGNSNIVLGVFKENDLILTARLATDRTRTSDQYAVELLNILQINQIDPAHFTGAILSSVVPELSISIQSAVYKITRCSTLLVGPGIRTGLNIKPGNPAELGADLVAGCVAAAARYPMPCLIWDLGTATKICVLDETGSFIGCTITPGVMISLMALSASTSQLPNISLEAPAKAIGTKSDDCMRSGSVFGTAAMLDGLSARIERELSTPVKTIVATGGLAKTIVSCVENRDIIYNKNLLLEGLKIIYDRNQK